MIHKTAIINQAVKLAATVSIGAKVVINKNVEIGEYSTIGDNVTIGENTVIGKNNRIYPYVSLGGHPEDKAQNDVNSSLHIKDNNIIREFVTINRGTKTTLLGSNNYVMQYSSIGSNASIGNHVTLVNRAVLASHTVVDDWGTIGSSCSIQQFCHVGKYAFVSKYSTITQDVLPFILVIGPDSRTCGINKVLLKRLNFSASTIAAIYRAYKIIFKRNNYLSQAEEKLQELSACCPEIQIIIAAIRAAKRGIVR